MLYIINVFCVFIVYFTRKKLYFAALLATVDAYSQGLSPTAVLVHELSSSRKLDCLSVQLLSASGPAKDLSQRFSTVSSFTESISRLSTEPSLEFVGQGSLPLLTSMLGLLSLTPLEVILRWLSPLVNTSMEF